MKEVVLNIFMEEFQHKVKYLTQDHEIIIKEGPFARVMADPDSLERILFNLLANSIRHSRGNTPIIVTWKIIPDFVEIMVADKGEGIDDKTLLHVFEPFYRGKYGKKLLDVGTGLGLTLVKSMVEAHGGSIRIDSLFGHYTNVHFTLPLYLKISES